MENFLFKPISDETILQPEKFFQKNFHEKFWFKPISEEMIFQP